MKSLVDHLSQYAAYHRDPRNIASHFIGIPLIVVAVAVLLSRPEWSLGGLWISLAVLLALASAWFYLRLEVKLGVLMTVLMGLSVWAGHALAQQSTMVWLSSGLAMFNAPIWTATGTSSSPLYSQESGELLMIRARTAAAINNRPLAASN